MPRRRVVVVQGGPSTEAEVSRESAKSVAKALTEAGHQAVRMELNAFLAESIREGGYDVVFPVSHGAVGEDGALQGLLEVLEIPYVGSNVLASAVAMDKRAARVVLAAAGLPVPHGEAVVRGGEAPHAIAARLLARLGDSLFVKPANGGSSIGATRLADATTEVLLASALEAAWALDDVAIVEQFVRGHEVTCGVLDVLAGPAPFVGLRALPPTEILAKGVFYTYETKYAPGQSDHVCPAPFAADVTARIQEVALAAHRALGCRDLSRVDVIVRDGVPAHEAVVALEVNTMPGFTSTSLFPEAAGIAGLPFPALCDALIESALARGATRRNAARAFPKT